MSTRFIDSKQAFRPVYALFQHEYLGVLLSPHVVQELPGGRLSLSHQGLHPESMEQFAHRLDDTDRKLIRTLAEIGMPEIFKRFGGKAKTLQDFFFTKFKDDIRKLTLSYVDRHMAEVLPLLRGKEVFLMGKDGYPAWRPVKVAEEEAQVIFHFRRTVQGTRYHPEIRLRGRRVLLGGEEQAVLSTSPAWMLVDDEIFAFPHNVDGAKLKPFMKREVIYIPRQTEAEYYRKFVTQLIERHDVLAEGFEILEVRQEPQFQLHVDSRDEKALRFDLKVLYGNHLLQPDPGRNSRTVMEGAEPDYAFLKIHRDTAAEKRVTDFFDKLNEGNLIGFRYMDRQDGLAWLSQHGDAIAEHGVEIVQHEAGGHIRMDVPEIELITEEGSDWFDIKAEVRIGDFRIPFIKFRQHILKGRRDYQLPDGSTAILPEEWFADYRHLIEVAEEREDGRLSLKPYQAGVLGLKSPGAQGFRERLQKILSSDGPEAAPAPDGLRAEMRDYQSDGYNWLHFMQRESLGGILADDMGLGKTVQTLAMLLSVKEWGAEGPSLVVMPTSLLYNWKSEARKFTPGLKVKIHAGIQRDRKADRFARYDLILTTYGIVRQDLEMLRTFPFHYIILDESQMIKNPQSKTYKAVLRLKSKYRLALTGTPLENTLLDLWSQMSFLNPGMLGSERYFRDYFVTPIEKENDEKTRERLRTMISPFILRRTKEQVAHELPEKVEQVHYCELEDEQRELYEETKNSYRNYLLSLVRDNSFNRERLHVLAGLQKLRQIAIHPNLVTESEDGELLPSGKYEEFRRLLDEVIGKGAKVLVFSQFVKLLHLIQGQFDREGITYAYLDGTTRDRQEVVRRFQEDEGVQVFLISLKAGGVGLNLTAAEYVFILDPWWNPAVERQAIDRSHRIGQQKTVFSYKFITRDTIEEKILKLQEKKSKLSADIVSADEDFFHKLKAEEIEALLV